MVATMTKLPMAIARQSRYALVVENLGGGNKGFHFENAIFLKHVAGKTASGIVDLLVCEQPGLFRSIRYSTTVPVVVEL